MITKNQYGFIELKEKPTNDELRNYYNTKYYQENKSSYQHIYEEEELKYIRNKIEQKFVAFKEQLVPKPQYSILDVGCGEGFCVKYFLDQGWDAYGCDFSEFGVKTHNADCVDRIMVGNIYDKLEELQHGKNKYDVIWLDNILEHVLDPLALIKICQNLATPQGIMVVEVPNDFSVLQNYLYANKYIDRQFWVAIPDHISYFNKEGLLNLCSAGFWTPIRVLSDFPIDFNLANRESNYVNDKSKGRAAHQQRMILDNLFHSISVEKTNKLYEALADLGLGRQLTGIFQQQA
ncbi:class I SAM-dependent methyltransferase [Chitinophaga sp. Mgbs1]|uniref:Class I SAM-dependent methyltransferase n=1 Tax=Chitinophaga solisilvae TaxID=1233460 RepID=A0A433WE52_9BACT|nr:class I SAM-dependent methyltransferase [Chitinophaga solisilvae]